LLLFPEDTKGAKENVHVLLDAPEEGQTENVVSWPGEYDYGGISIKGIGHDEGNQVSYIVTTEGLRCGFFSTPLQVFTEKDEEMIGNLDVLVIPADDVKKAQKLVEGIDPPVVIPLRMKDEKTFKEVLAACGGKDAETVTEVKLKKGSLPTESREVYVLK
jgi:hypothetical protein